MKISHAYQMLLIFLSKNLFSLLMGITLEDWVRLLFENRFVIAPHYWPRAVLLTAGSLGNSICRYIENLSFGRAIVNERIFEPLFILGHWRSGTSLLHNLLALDRQFAYPNLYQVCFPHTFLCTERAFAPIFSIFIPKQRVMDGMGQTVKSPLEEEFALSLASFCSPYMSWVFPGREEHYDRYLTFHGISKKEVERWKTVFLSFLKKLTYKYGRPLLLKSPPHTCRIRLLLEMFPKARFVHIHRDPYAVFQSTEHLLMKMTPVMRLQRHDWQDSEARILRRHQIMYNSYFEERVLIADGRLHEVCFEELERDPVAQIRAIYENLGLPGFSTIQPILESYIQSIAQYRKNKYSPLDPEIRRQIAKEWQRCFEEWGYPY
jgi:hypothetical protein